MTTVIDSHMHVNFNKWSLRNIINYLDREKIDCCWLLTWDEVNVGRWDYYPLSIRDTYEAYLKYPSRIVPFYAPDPHRNDASIQLENWYKKGIRGCGELKATLNWNSEEVKNLLKTVRLLKMPIVFHMEESETREIPYSTALFDRLIFYGMRTNKRLFRIPQKILHLLVNNFAPFYQRVNSSYFFPGYMLDFVSFEAILQEYPDINFIAHGSMFWKHISSDANACQKSLPRGPVIDKGLIWHILRDYPNLYADISSNSGFNALTRDANNAKNFLSEFNDKILYGTDNLIKGQKEFLDSLHLSREDYKKIYGDNAARLIFTNN